MLQALTGCEIRSPPTLKGALSNATLNLISEKAMAKLFIAKRGKRENSMKVFTWRGEYFGVERPTEASTNGARICEDDDADET